MSERFSSLREATVATALAGPGTTTPELREAIARGEPPKELRALVEKIRNRPYDVNDEDMSSLMTRYSEDQLFEILVAAALGAAEKRLLAGLRALEGT